MVDNTPIRLYTPRLNLCEIPCSIHIFAAPTRPITYRIQRNVKKMKYGQMCFLFQLCQYVLQRNKPLKSKSKSSFFKNSGASGQLPAFPLQRFPATSRLGPQTRSPEGAQPLPSSRARRSGPWLVFGSKMA